MVGRFLLGVLSGGALVAGAFVLGAVLFPIAEAPAASTATDPVTEAPPMEVAVAETGTDPAAPPASTGEPAPLPSAETGQTAVAPPAPVDGVSEAPAESPAETALADLSAEAPSNTAGVEPAPSTAQATTEPSAPGAAEDLAEAPATGPTADAASGTEDLAMTQEEEAPLAPEATVVTVPALPVLDPEAAAAALVPPETPESGEAAPDTALPDVAAAPETGAEPAPAALSEAPPADAAPQPSATEAADDLPATADAAPEPAPGAMPVPEPGTVRLPGTPASDLPGAPSEALEEPEVASLPAPASEGSSGSTFEPAPGFDGTDDVIVGRLPRVGDTPEEQEETIAEATPADTRPLARFAAPFENPEGKPLLAVVLIDPGSDDLDRDALAALPFPVTMALDPLDPASAERAAIYRAGGKEVVMLATGIAEGAQASDIEVAFQEMDRGLPEAVAVMDLAQSAFQSSRPLASLVVPVVGAQGRGLLTWDQGLNAADQVAQRDDVPAAIIFRDFATGGTDRGAIRRLMDRAVFKAGQDGRVVLAGIVSADLVAALLEWTVEGRAATVAIAPVSAVLAVE